MDGGVAKLFYEVFIGLRHLRPKKRDGFISIVSLLAVAGVALGVSTLIIVLAVMDGFENDLKEKILGVQAHLVILAPNDEKISEDRPIIDGLRSLDGVVAASPFIQTQAILTNEGRATGIILKGIDPLLERGVTDIQSKVVAGSAGLKRDEDILIGSELASCLGLGVGSSVLLIAPRPGASISRVFPHFVPFKVEGIFKTGMYDYDATLACLNLKVLQRTFGPGDGVDGVAVKIRDIYTAPLIKREIASLFDYRYGVRTWMELNRNLFSALRLEKTVMFIILVLIILVAGMSIASTLTMIVMHKRREIGVLLGLGATRWGIVRTFLFEGALIGILGTSAGLLVGLSCCWMLSRFEFIRLPQDVYYIDYLPVNIQIQDVLVIVLSSIILAILAAIYPANRAARLDPVEIIRYE